MLKKVKRIPIGRLTRLALTALLGGTVLLCLAMLVRALMLPAEISGSRAVFEYEQNAKIDYTVGLHPNPLFDSDELGPGIAYFLNLITDIRVHATYSLRTDRPIPVECVYRLTGTLRAYRHQYQRGRSHMVEAIHPYRGQDHSRRRRASDSWRNRSG
ncbi:MAG: hypothetical protein ACOX5Q_09795 [Bacillota bacterium]